MKNESSRFDTIAPDEGRNFLKQLDAALQGGAVSGSGTNEKALADFGARAARALTPSGSDSPPAEMRAKVEQQLQAPPRGAARMGRLMARWRIGVLDLAALVVIGVLSVSLYFALQNKSAAHPGPKINPNIAHTAAGDGDGKEKAQPPPSPPPAPEAPPDVAHAAELSETDVYDADPDEPWAKKIRTQLKENVTLDLNELSLEAVMTMLSQKLKIDIVIEPQVRAAGADKTPITLKTSGMSGEEVLKWVCRLADLQYGLRDQMVIISQKSAAQPAYDTEVYDVSKTQMPIELIVLLIRERLFPADFADPRTSVEAFKGKLLVTQRRSVQTRILRLLAVLSANAGESEITPVPPTPQPEWMKEIEAALAKPVSFNFVETDVNEAIAFIRMKTGVTIIINPKLLAAGPPPVTLKVTDMPAKVALEWILRLENFGYEFKDHAVYIREPMVGRSGVLKLYNVGDLADSAQELEQLREKIVNLIAPESWDAALGTSAEVAGSRLIVLQSPEVHAKIHELLAKLRSTGIKPELPPTKPEGNAVQRY